MLQRVWNQGPSVYSDINFILLGIAIERITGQPLIEVAPPAGFTFRPDPPTCAATTACASCWASPCMIAGPSSTRATP